MVQSIGKIKARVKGRFGRESCTRILFSPFLGSTISPLFHFPQKAGNKAGRFIRARTAEGDAKRLSQDDADG